MQNKTNDVEVLEWVVELLTDTHGREDPYLRLFRLAAAEVRETCLTPIVGRHNYHNTEPQNRG